MEYLKIWTDFREVMEPLNDAEKGRLFDAMLNYAADGEEQHLTGNERFIWAYARQTIDRTRAESERLRVNGAKGGRPKKQQEAVETKEKQPEARKSAKEFVKPTVEEVREYCKGRNNGVDAEQFVAFYASKGWKVGNQPMRDWKQAVITWEKRDKREAKPTKTVVAQQYSQRDYSNSNMTADESMEALKKFLGGQS